MVYGEDVEKATTWFIQRQYVKCERKIKRVGRYLRYILVRIIFYYGIFGFAGFLTKIRIML